METIAKELRELHEDVHQLRREMVQWYLLEEDKQMRFYIIAARLEILATAVKNFTPGTGN